jgi:hypothetical protein
MEILEVVFFFYKTEKYTDPVGAFCGDYADFLLIERYAVISVGCLSSKPANCFWRLKTTKLYPVAIHPPYLKNQEYCSM